MIDFAKYVGIDNSELAVPFGMVDYIAIDRFKEGGPVVGIINGKPMTPERRAERARNIEGCVREIERIELEKKLAEMRRVELEKTDGKAT